MLRSGTEHFEQHLGMPPGYSGARMPNRVSTHRSKPIGSQSRSQGTHRCHAASIHAVRTYLGRTHVRMTHLLQNGSNIRTLFQQVSRDQMPVAAGVTARMRIPADAGEWKPVLPTLLKRGIWVAVNGLRTELAKTNTSRFESAAPERASRVS